MVASPKPTRLAVLIDGLRATTRGGERKSFITHIFKRNADKHIPKYLFSWPLFLVQKSCAAHLATDLKAAVDAGRAAGEKTIVSKVRRC